MDKSERKFKALESFSSEGRNMIESEIYIAYPIDNGYKLVFENSEMNFTRNLFEKNT